MNAAPPPALHIVFGKPPGDRSMTFYAQSESLLTEFRSAAHVYTNRADAEKTLLTWVAAGRGWTFGIEPVETLYGF